jgi:hypothetical protein
MWDVKEVIPVITGANGIISQSPSQYLSNKPGDHDIKQLQKAAILGTAHERSNILVQNI